MRQLLSETADDLDQRLGGKDSIEAMAAFGDGGTESW